MSRPTKASDKRTSGLLATLAEWALLVCLFAAYAGCPPPDVNESHYLVKAKHFWNPQWCVRDLFLQSADVHLTFYVTVGWLTRWLSLEATAYVGRLLAWTVLAWGWLRWMRALTSTRLLGLLAAAWFLVFSECRMAGEWVVGGVEAKPFAYAFVFLGWAAWVTGNARSCWLYFGLATVFHTVIGVWSFVAAILACFARRQELPPLRSVLVWILLGALLAAPTTWLAGRAVATARSFAEARQADRILVYERLGHHLAFHQFAYGSIAKFVALSAATVAVGRYLGRYDVRSTRQERLLQGTLWIAACGVLIDQSLLWNLDLAAMLLKYYWYRLADALVPAVAAAWIAVFYEHLVKRNALWGQRFLVVAMLVPTICLSVSLTYAQRDVRPRAERHFDRTVEGKQRAQRKYENWLRVCEFIRSETPADALFWTPHGQQTFKWHAQRAEIVNWKDVPQDTAHVLEWKRRMEDLYPRDWPGLEVTAWSDEQIVEKLERYGATYLVVERGRMRRALGNRFRQVYPNVRHENRDFAVYQLQP